MFTVDTVIRERFVFAEQNGISCGKLEAGSGKVSMAANAQENHECHAQTDSRRSSQWRLKDATGQQRAQALRLRAPVAVAASACREKAWATQALDARYASQHQATSFFLLLQTIRSDTHCSSQTAAAVKQ